MTDRKELIEGIIKLLKNYEFGVPIERFLKSKGVPESQFAALILEAETIISEKEIALTSIKSKILWGLWLGLSMLTIYVFYFVIPHTKMNTFPGMYSLIGTALLILFLCLSFVYYNSWKRENILNYKNSNNYSILFLISALPGVIIYFIFFWHFESVKDDILKSTYKEVIGTIIDGTSWQGRRIKTSKVTVKFRTLDGLNVVADEDVAEYEFNNFYKGQRVHIAYSSIDPNNIEILTNKSDITKITGSEERSITPSDLIFLLSQGKSKLKDNVSKITFGWEYKDTSILFNSEKNLIIGINGNQIFFGTNELTMYTFPKLFAELGFKRLDKDEKNILMQKEMIFKSEKYYAVIEMLIIDHGPYYKTTILLNEK